MDVKDSKPVTLTEVQTILKAKEKQYSKADVELRFEQRRSLEHAQKFAKVSVKDAKDMAKKLAELGLELNDERIVKIVDELPSSVDDIRAIFAKERFKYGEEELKKIVDIVDQYR
ncbi:MAG: RNA polymerase Rpb4 family protein [Candidatus Altiarchaeota archaeon]|nr:RNA polymerase Rpb4 family protein [Candidatus Altiarchaeota archaeon]